MVRTFDKQLLPDFLMIGTAKAGTTSLYHYLGQHPDIFISAKKEPHFFYLHGTAPNFSGLYDQAIWERIAIPDLEQYQALFTEAGDRIKGEASTNYLYYHQQTARRIYDYNPQIKLIVVLRNPVERAFSAYRHRRSVSREPLASFEAALAAENQRIADRWDASAHYFHVGLYSAALEHYLRIFAYQQMRILIYEQDIQQNIQATMQNLFTFLEVVPDVPLDMSRVYNTYREFRNPILKHIDRLARHNPFVRRIKALVPSAVIRSARDTMSTLRKHNAVDDPLSKELRRRLLDRYRADILKTQALIQRDLSIWLDST